MKNRPRYVFDTSTMVSATLFEHSKPDRAFRRALKRGRLLLSLSTLEELAEVLQRESFDRYVTQAEREEFLETLVERALFIEPTEEIQACRDPSDNKFLELAVSGQVRCIVSSDEDLLVLHPFRGIPILTPAEFLEAIEEEDSPEEEA